jgi:hypothetical protein
VLPALGPSHSSSSSRAFASTTASAEGGDEGDIPRRRRRSTTESRAAMRRTTVRKSSVPRSHAQRCVQCGLCDVLRGSVLHTCACGSCQCRRVPM